MGITGSPGGTPDTRGQASVALPAILVLAGAISVQSGAGIATRLFTELPPAAVTALRLWTAALIMLLLAGRPTVRALADLARRRAWQDAAIAVGFGIVLGFMNFAIYQAFARIPLGIAVTIEFLGPLTVTVAGTLRPADDRGQAAGGRRRAAGLGYAALALAGVVLLGGAIGSAHLDLAGVAWAVGAGTAWAGYIIASKATGQRFEGSAGLAIAMCVAAAAVTAPGVIAGAPKMFRPRFLAEGAGIGLLSSVIPYWLELEALRRIRASLFGVWMSVQPAVAALIGLVFLGQRLSIAEWFGVCFVAVASAGAAYRAAVSAGEIPARSATRPATDAPESATRPAPPPPESRPSPAPPSAPR